VVVGAVVALAAPSCVSPTARARQAEQRLQKAIKQLAASGAPTKATQLAKPPVRDAENAAPIYRKAFEAIHVTHDDRDFIVNLSRGRLSLADPAVAARGERILKQNAAALQLIHRAAAIPRCDFRLDWSKGAALELPQFSKLRACAHLLELEAIMLAHQGRVDDALAVCGDSFGVVKAADEPLLIGALVQYSIIAITSRSLEQVLSGSQPSGSACRRLGTYVASIDLTRSLTAALTAERAMDMSLFDQARASRDPVKFVWELSGQFGPKERPPKVPRNSWFVRWWLASDELLYLELMDRAIADASLPYRRAGHAEDALGDRVRTHRGIPAPLLTAILFPVYSRSHAARDRAIATLGLIETALLLKAYRAEHGGYPQSLQQLSGIAGHPLPVDPFSGKPFVYHREGAGFVIYSWGPNLKNDGGKVGTIADEGDIVMKCSR
jgi:hypothetical protein